MNLQDRKTLMIDYLRMKLDEGDYHGVADAAMDLREIDVEIRLERENGKHRTEASSVGINKYYVCSFCDRAFTKDSAITCNLTGCPGNATNEFYRGSSWRD